MILYFQYFAGWCNGSILGSDPKDKGSIPFPATKEVILLSVSRSRRSFCFLFCLLLVLSWLTFGFLSFFSLAADVSFPVVPVLDDSLSNWDSFLVASMPRYPYIYAATKFNQSPVYLFFVFNSDNGYYRPVFVTEGSYVHMPEASYLLHYQNISSVIASSSFVSFNQSLNLSYSNIGFAEYSSIVSSVPIFSSVNDGLSAFRDFLDNPPTPGSENITITLPAGNAVYIPVKINAPISLSTTFNNLTSLISWGDNPFEPINQMDGFTGVLPADKQPLPSQVKIDWQKSGDLNLFGQTDKAEYHTKSISNTYYYVVNPYYKQAGHGDIVLNGTIEITIPRQYINGDYSLYSITSTIGGTGVIEVPDTDNPLTGTSDENGNTTWVDSDGNPATPSVGGGNAPIVSESISDILTNFFNNISSLLSAGHTAIRTLVSYVADFGSVITGLFDWLPPQIVSVLIAAFTLCIVIGVLKVFL